MGRPKLLQYAPNTQVDPHPLPLPIVTATPSYSRQGGRRPEAPGAQQALRQLSAVPPRIF